MNVHDDFEKLGDLWRSSEDDALPSRPVADIGRQRRAQRIYLGVEGGIALVGSVVGIALIIAGELAIGLAALVFSVFGGIIGWMTRKMNIDILERSVAEHFEATNAALKARRNHNLAGVMMFLAATLFMGFVRWQGHGHFSTIDVLIMAGLMAAAVFYTARARRMHRNLKQNNAQSEMWKAVEQDL